MGGGSVRWPGEGLGRVGVGWGGWWGVFETGGIGVAEEGWGSGGGGYGVTCLSWGGE